ncbi:MAG: hypothetical protein J1F42_14270 [Lachnospiraceae bacterium]|nr:hypothetical protein [Lachnospiraceae bacterium]
MNVRMKRLLSIVLIVAVVILVAEYAAPTTRRKRIDISNMRGEAPVKIISLNTYISTNDNHELAYILGENGSIYVLRCIDGKYDVDLWQPEFWDGIKITDLCMNYPMMYALAMDEDGQLYIWNKEYGYDPYTADEIKKEQWNISRIDGIPKVTDVFAAYNQFVIVTEIGDVYRWYPKDQPCPAIEEMERLDVEPPIINIAATKEELLILDRNHVLWSVENGTSRYLQKDVQNIVQGPAAGFAVQTTNSEINVYNSLALERDYEKTTFADRYEVSRIAFEGDVSSLAVSSSAAVVCIDGDKLYRWGRKSPKVLFGTYPGYEETYETPVKINIDTPQYYTLVGHDMIYVDNQNNMFAIIQN